MVINVPEDDKPKENNPTVGVLSDTILVGFPSCMTEGTAAMARFLFLGTVMGLP